MKITTDLETLRKKSTEVGIGSISRLNFTLVKQLKNTLKRYGGLGISAIQLGISQRVFIFKNNRNELITCYNPIIKEMYDEFIFPNEGCLSLPKVQVNTKRYKYCEVEYYDEHKQLRRMLLQELEAVEFQHECDHLNGMLIIDRQVKQQPRVNKNKVGRNDPCPCGSGKKYKKCCLRKAEAERFNI